MSPQSDPSQFILLTGPIFLGAILNWCLLGILVAQVYIFHVSFPKDRWSLQAIVYGLFIMETVQTVLFTHYSWHVLVRNWGDPQVLQGFTWSCTTIPILDGLVSIVAHFFFAWRIWMLKKCFDIAVPASILVILVSLMQGLSAVVNGVRFYFVTDIAHLQEFDAGVIVWLAGSFACDLIIAIAMIIMLLRAIRAVSLSKNTTSLCTSLIVLVVETGAATVIAASLQLIFFLTMPKKLLHLMVAVVICKIYSNAVLANLNGRLRHYRLEDAATTHTSLSTGCTVHDISRLIFQDSGSDIMDHKSANASLPTTESCKRHSGADSLV